MNNLFTYTDRLEIERRIRTLHPGSSARWGRMTVEEMLCHTGDQLWMALGYIPAQDARSLAGRTILKALVLWGLPTPKGKIETLPEIDQSRGAGTRSRGFAHDREQLLNRIAGFCSKGGHFRFARHAIFGALNRRAWGRLAWLHLDHHLRQFGV